MYGQSDRRIKTNIVDLNDISSLQKVLQIPARNYQYKDKLKRGFGNVTGFIAQEVKAALDTAGVSDFGGWKEDQYGVQQVSREMFVIPLVKAVQELSAQVTALQAEVNTLKGG